MNRVEEQNLVLDRALNEQWRLRDFLTRAARRLARVEEEIYRLKNQMPRNPILPDIWKSARGVS